MTSINIFEDKTEIDLEKLIETRLIFLANSGGGKSYAFRKLLSKGKIITGGTEPYEKELSKCAKIVYGSGSLITLSPELEELR